MFTIEMLNLMWTGLLETLYMTLISAALSYVLGLPLGLVLVVTDKDGVRPCPALNRALGTIVNALRSVPFLILLFTVLPVTRFLTGTTIGPTATIVPQIVLRVLLPEALPSLINGAAIATTTLLGYSAMAGICGGGGLGAIAINYGYYRGQVDIMLVMVLILVLIVQLSQMLGERVAKCSDKRIR